MQRQLFRFLAVVFLSCTVTSLAAETAPAPPPEQQPATAPLDENAWRRLTPAQPTRVAPGKVEVLEFFWYGCPHCYATEKHVEAWLADQPEDVVFVRVPATLNRGWVLMAQAYYTAEALDVLDTMHPALFAAFHEDNVPLQTPEQIAAYFEAKAGIDKDTFANAFNSLQVASRVQRADQLARRYRVGGVPAMAVNGKFITDPNQANGYADMLEIVDQLTKQELQAQAE